MTATDMESEVNCKCLKIIGHLEYVDWLLWPRDYRRLKAPLPVGDFTDDRFLWLHYVESSAGLLADDDVLKSLDSRYWSIHDVQRYFIGDLHCEQVLFPYQYPSLRMPTRLGQHLFKFNTSLKIPPILYTREFKISLEVTLKKMVYREVQMDRLIVSDQLIKLDLLDYFKRKTFFRLLLDIISFQDRLQLVSFENLCCKRLEGVRLVEHLACFNASTLKYLFLWRFVLPNENPLLINYSYLTGSGFYIPRPDTTQCFLRSLCELRNLRLLALEYAHIADNTGGALIALLPLMRRPHFRLQLICRENQVPGYQDPAMGVGGLDIPDTAWRRVNKLCPDLYLLMAFFRVRDYDNLRRFLTPSLPLRELHLEYGIDVLQTQRQDSDVSALLRHLAYRYRDCLVAFSLHQWRFATIPLRCVLELMPFLMRFDYTGMVEDEVDLQRMLQFVACGVCHKLRFLKIQIQDESNRRAYWRDCANYLKEEFSEIMNLYGINFCMNLYKS